MRRKTKRWRVSEQTKRLTRACDLSEFFPFCDNGKREKRKISGPLLVPFLDFKEPQFHRGSKLVHSRGKLIKWEEKGLFPLYKSGIDTDLGNGSKKEFNMDQRAKKKSF